MMRPNWIGWSIVAFFLIGGAIFWATIPGIFIGQIWVAVSLLLAVVYLRMNRRADEADEMKRTGIRGEAHILETTQTGVYVNNQPRVKLKLRISAPGVAPFDDEKATIVPLIALGRLSAGTPLAVYLKPDDPRDYVIDWSGGAPGDVTVGGAAGDRVGLGPDAQEAVLSALKEHGVDTSTGTVDLRTLPQARAAVLEALSKHGIDAAHRVAARDPATPIDDKGEPLERLMKLQQLRAANLITAEEFESYRKRILEDV